MFAKIKKYLTDYNIKMLEEKKAKNGGLFRQDEDMLNNMKFGIGRTS